MNTSQVWTRTDWRKMAKEVVVLIRRLRQKPGSMKKGYQISPGGILNAYREGDISFARAVSEINRLISKR